MKPNIPGYLAPVTKLQWLAHGALIVLDHATVPTFMLGLYLLGQSEHSASLRTSVGLCAALIALFSAYSKTAKQRQAVREVYSGEAVWKTAAKKWQSTSLMWEASAKSWEETARKAEAKLKALSDLPDDVWGDSNLLRQRMFKIVTGDEPFVDVPTQEAFESEPKQHKEPTTPADYLEGLKWDGQLRLDASLGPGNAEGADLFFRNAVRRALHPGCLLERTIVLVGAQGCGKSAWLHALAGSFHATISEDDVSPVRALSKLSESWVVEVDVPGQVEWLKALVTTCTGKKREWDGSVSTFPMLWVPVAVSNDKPSPLWDNTRRFHVVRVGQLDAEAVRRDRDQLWAEAVKRFIWMEPLNEPAVEKET